MANASESATTAPGWTVRDSPSPSSVPRSATPAPTWTVRGSLRGPEGPGGPEGPPGPPGPSGGVDIDFPDLTLLIENGLI